MENLFTNAFQHMENKEAFYKAVFLNMDTEDAAALRLEYYKTQLKHMGNGVTIGTGVKIVNPQWISLGDGVRICDNCTLIARGEGGIILGNDVWLNDHVYLDTESAENGYIRVENNVYIGTGTTLFGHSGLEIGDHALLAQNITITPYSHIFEDPNSDIITQGGHTRKVTLGRDCYLGMNVCVVYSADVGDGAVIGSGAVVVKSIPPMSVAVGNPAKVIRERKYIPK